ncbi:MAG: antibiotic biosynthesis monooxygenase [Roseivirga sp.]|nr:antibiotic biosynthesis monooxygenase [Roseivirga sp.]
MISRIWHGWTSHENADRYEHILKTEVMHEIEGKEVEGFKEIRLLRRAHETEVEFITIMQFERLEDIRKFAGEDYERAFVPDVARAVLKRFDATSQHYEVRHELTY